MYVSSKASTCTLRLQLTEHIVVIYLYAYMHVVPVRTNLARPLRGTRARTCNTFGGARERRVARGVPFGCTYVHNEGECVPFGEDRSSKGCAYAQHRCTYVRTKGVTNRSSPSGNEGARFVQARPLRGRIVFWLFYTTLHNPSWTSPSKTCVR